MKARLLTLFPLLALLLVSTAVLADGRPSGIRISRVVGSGGSTTPTVEIDVTVDTTFVWASGYSSTVLIGNAWQAGGGSVFYLYASTDFSVPLPWAIDWGDGYYLGQATLFGPPGGPFRGKFVHTYLTPGSYTITVGDALTDNTPVCCVNSGNIVYGPSAQLAGFASPDGNLYGPQSIAFGSPRVAALTANTTVRTGFGIPTTNVYGLIALALLLVGSGLLLYRKPQRT